jgi:hypothetical protein
MTLLALGKSLCTSDRKPLSAYLAGKIDQWWARQDQKGPVTTTEEARALLDELPLGKAKLMEFEFTELSPLTPLHLLIKEA